MVEFVVLTSILNYLYLFQVVMIVL